MVEVEYFIICDMIYGNCFKIIFIKNIDNFLFMFVFNNEKYVFLRFGKYYFISGYICFLLWNEIKVYFNV